MGLMTGKADTVAATATSLGALDKGELTLLGLFGPEGDLSALVRLPGGRIVKVVRGDRLTQGQVVAIDADGLMLQRGDKTRRVIIPGG
jgi:hypothetical protein